MVSIERIQFEVGSIFCFRRANRLAPGHPDYPVQMAVFGAIYVGIATTVHMAIVLLAAQIAPLAAARTHQNMIRRILALALVAVAPG